MTRSAFFGAYAAALLCCLGAGAAAQTGDVASEPAPAPAPEAEGPVEPLLNLGVRMAYNSDYGPVFGARVRTGRLAGGTQSLSLSIEASEDRLRYSIFYAAPQLFGDSPAFGLALAAAQSEASGSFDFDSQTLSVEPRLTWRLNPQTRIAAYAQFGYAEIAGLDPATSQLIRNDEGEQQSQRLGLEYNRSIRSNEDTLRRLAYRASVELGQTDRDNTFTEIAGRVSAGWRIGADDNIRLRAQLRGGAINSSSGATNIGDRTFLGSSALRGFAFGGFGPRDTFVTGTPALGGNVYTVARFDAQFDDLFQSERVVPGVFMDVGSLWGLDDTGGGLTGADTVDDAANLRASIGLTFEINTGIGPIGLSFAHPIQREDYDVVQEFSLNFQHSF